jgi:DNA-binding transcriptional MerR regulator
METQGPTLRAIGGVAEELGLPQHVLRHWETEFRGLQPVRRAGRRYYRPEHVEFIRGLQQLLHVRGMTTEGARRLIRQQGENAVRALGRGNEGAPTMTDSTPNPAAAAKMAARAFTHAAGRLEETRGISANEVGNGLLAAGIQKLLEVLPAEEVVLKLQVLADGIAAAAGEGEEPPATSH